MAVLERSPLERARDVAIVYEKLEALRDAGRKIAARLQLVQVILGEPTLAQRRRENICGGDRVLNREIDADAAHRRHRVRRIANAQQARAMPLLQAVDLYREQFDIVPVAQFADALSKKRREVPDRLSKSRHPPLTHLLVRPLGNHEA